MIVVMASCPVGSPICGYSVDHVSHVMHHMTCSPDTVVVNHDGLQSS